MRRRSAAAVVAAVAAGGAGLLSGCAPGPITAAHLQASVSTTFANLWVYHESEVGHPHPGAAALDATTVCLRGLPTQVQHGAGSDWVCHVTWLVDGPGTPVTATYNLNVDTDGCYAADGDGPASVNGSPIITDAAGGTRVNPMFQFNGCIDTA